MNKWELYDWYIENSIDENKGEIPLSFTEWKREIYPQDIKFLNELENKGI